MSVPGNAAKAAAPGNPAQAGFTLIELLVALAILALATGIAFPAIGQMTARAAMDGAVARTGLVLVRARADAIRRDEPVIARAEPAEDGVTALWPAAGIAFHGDGSGSGGTVVLERGGRRASVTVDPATGALAWTR